MRPERVFLCVLGVLCGEKSLVFPMHLSWHELRIANYDARPYRTVSTFTVARLALISKSSSPRLLP